MSAIALVGLRIWDGRSERADPAPRTLRIEGERIAGLGEDPRLRDGAEVIDCSGASAIPGLIDAHVHLTLDPEIRSPDDQQKVGRDALFEGMAARARAMLAAGITTARDLGGGAWHELELRDRIASGELVGPRLLCAGQPVTTPHGHCWFWGGEAASAEEIRAVVRRQVAHGCDCIKVMATGGVITKGTSPRDAQFEVAQLRAVVEEARTSERTVAAHCHGTPGIANATRARVTSIEHCSFFGARGFGSEIDPYVIDEMARVGVYASPTVNSGWKRFFEEDGAPGRFARSMGFALRALRSGGVTLIASTDAGIPGVVHHRLPEALAVLARMADLRPLDALRAATSDAAAALGLAERTGALAVGLDADLLIVDGDPLDDLGALLRPRLVFARGRRVDPAGPVSSEHG